MCVLLPGFVRVKLRVCLSDVILHGSVHKSDYHKILLKRGLWVVPFFCFIRKHLQHNDVLVHLCASRKLLLKWCIVAFEWKATVNDFHQFESFQIKWITIYDSLLLTVINFLQVHCTEHTFSFHMHELLPPGHFRMSLWISEIYPRLFVPLWVTAMEAVFPLMDHSLN